MKYEKTKEPVLVIRLLDYKGQEHAIQVSISNEKPILEGWSSFGIIEMLNAEICDAIRRASREKSILGFQAIDYRKQTEGYEKVIEWEQQIL
jgi:hypothetical protein